MANLTPATPTRAALTVAPLDLTSPPVDGAATKRVHDARHTVHWERLAPVVPAAVALVTVAVFAPALHNGFVDWDDNVVILDNHHYRGFAWANLGWMFTTVLMGHYVPVTWLTLALDYRLWGIDPAGYHLTSLLLHAANAALFYLLARRLLAAAANFGPLVERLGAATAALFFALHPLRAESVAWVTERRDVLSGFFFLLTLLGYLRARDAAGSTRSWLRAGSLACFALGALSKSMVMTLPALLFIVDVYPFRHVPTIRAWFTTAARPLRREKLPYVVLGAVTAMLGYYAQAANAFITPMDQIGWAARPAMVAYSVAFYVSKTFVPLGLSPLYELPAVVHPLEPRFLVRGLAVVGLTLVLILLRHRAPAGLAAWLSYVVVLAPVSGIVHSGYQLAHDRYSYLACLAWALVVGGTAATIARAARDNRLRPVLATAALAAFALWLATIGALGRQQVEAWHDTDTLWRVGLDSEPDCGVCLHNHASLLFNQGQAPLARADLERLLALRPERIVTHRQLAIVLAGLGEPEAAIAHFRIYLAQKPDDAGTHNNLGVALRTVGRQQDALVEFQWSVHLEPADPVARLNLGMALFDLGQRDLGMTHLQRAIELAPENASAHYGLGMAQLVLGRRDDAEREYRRVRALDAKIAAVMGPALLTEW